jgi:methylated-DNA-[protein]-cysteine S-methyltransferase
MKRAGLIGEVKIRKHLKKVIHEPPASALNQSRRRVRVWFAQTAPLIQWDEMTSPLGRLFVGVSQQGLCAVEFGRGEAEFLERFDPQARVQKNPQAAAQAMTQLREYFSGARAQFNLDLDLSSLTPFQRSVLDAACRIAPGSVWTYHRLAREIGRPNSSRPVGQALGRNPIPIVVPCHRVVASDGSLCGYSGGSGLNAKRWLLRLEGALS